MKNTNFRFFGTFLGILGCRQRETPRLAGTPSGSNHRSNDHRRDRYRLRVQAIGDMRRKGQLRGPRHRWKGEEVVSISRLRHPFLTAEHGFGAPKTAGVGIGGFSFGGAQRHSAWVGGEQSLRWEVA